MSHDQTHLVHDLKLHPDISAIEFDEAHNRTLESPKGGKVNKTPGYVRAASGNHETPNKHVWLTLK